jgi:hypothetical protein
MCCRGGLGESLGQNTKSTWHEKFSNDENLTTPGTSLHSPRSDLGPAKGLHIQTSSIQISAPVALPIGLQAF